MFFCCNFIRIRIRNTCQQSEVGEFWFWLLGFFYKGEGEGESEIDFQLLPKVAELTWNEPRDRYRTSASVWEAAKI